MDNEKYPGNFFMFPGKNFNKYSSIILIVFLILFLLYFLTKNLRNYLRNRNKLKEMAADYERKRESRNELKFHYFWALDRGERNNANSIGRQILQMDKELKELYEQYQYYKKFGVYQLKKL